MPGSAGASRTMLDYNPIQSERLTKWTFTCVRATAWTVGILIHIPSSRNELLPKEVSDTPFLRRCQDERIETKYST